ncbi:OmpA family protein [Flagellimonas sp. DF-77]|uniref:OmpA family protein n=1 Tax=Flagellimonas algarum TaxID=3230298 RepID=UPI0033953829
MKRPVLIVIILLLCACKNDVANSERAGAERQISVEVTTSDPSEIEPVESEPASNATVATFSSLDMDGQTPETIIQKLEELKNDPTLPTELLPVIEQRIALEKSKSLENKEAKMLSAFDAARLVTAFNALNASEGLVAKLEKLGKVDSMMGRGPRSEIRLDTDVAEFVSAEIETDATPMSNDETLFLRAFSSVVENQKSAAEIRALIKKLDSFAIDPNTKSAKPSEAFQNQFKVERSKAKIALDYKLKKARRAKEKFRKMNPHLFFEDGKGATYFGSNTAIYLPMGDLSFADELVDSKHPEQLGTASNILGVPDGIELSKERLENVHSLGLGGSVILQFTDNALVDVNGPDIFVFEMGKIEPTALEVSIDGKNWVSIGEIGGGTAQVDIGEYVEPNTLYYYVRLTDLMTSSAIPGADVDAVAAIGSAMRLNLDSSVLFDTGASNLKPEGVVAIKELVGQILFLEKGTIVVEGHTDDVGSSQNNQRLALARARSVSEELKKQLNDPGFDFIEKGFGERRPIATNETEEGRQKNRRVEVLVVPRG